MIKEIVLKVRRDFGNDTVPALLDRYGYQPEEGITPEQFLERAIAKELYRTFAETVVNRQVSAQISAVQSQAETKLETAVAEVENDINLLRQKIDS